jgi:2-methylisocitrate lyase-like PEP mutase family enzyme
MTDSLNRKLKRRVWQGEPLLLPGAPNALAARIIEELGFEAVYATGAGITNSYLGMPDLGLLTLTELAAHVAAMRDAITLPILVDADTGFGNASNVARTVRVLERAGANGMQIEDQVSPKRCGHFDGKEVIATEEMVRKIQAAADARRDGDFLIIARTDARAELGFDAAIERAGRYAEAGSDLTFVEAPRSREEVARIPQLLGCPQVINMVVGGKTPLLDLGELQALGYAVVLYANAALQGAIHGMEQVLEPLRRTGTIAGVLDRITPFAERQRIVRKPLFDELDKKYSSRP